MNKQKKTETTIDHFVFEDTWARIITGQRWSLLTHGGLGGEIFATHHFPSALLLYIPTYGSSDHDVVVDFSHNRKSVCCWEFALVAAHLVFVHYH